MNSDKSKGNKDRLFGAAFSDEFFASKVLADPTSSEMAKEFAIRLLAGKARVLLRNAPEPPGLTAVSSTGAGPLVNAGDQILSPDGRWRVAVESEVGTSIDRYVRVARDFR